MNKILTVDQVAEISQTLHKQGKSIVLAGGVFDILHSGHVAFLKASKNHGDVLLVMVESDKKVQETKGSNRPIHIQKDRERILAALPYVDFVITLPYLKSNEEYDLLVQQIKPDIIATTARDPYRIHKERQAEKYNSRVIDVLPRLENISTTHLVESLPDTTI